MAQVYYIGPYRKLTNMLIPLYVVDFNTDIVVEAGGVEPPSEKARHEETTCVAGSDVSVATSEPARAVAA
jgi:hypothetical protein